MLTEEGSNRLWIRLMLALTHPREPQTLENDHISFTVPDFAFRQMDTKLHPNTKISGIYVYTNDEMLCHVHLKNDGSTLSINVHGDVGQRIFASCIDVLKRNHSIIPLLVEPKVTVCEILRKQLKIVRVVDLDAYRHSYVLIPSDERYLRCLFSWMKDVLLTHNASRTSSHR